MGLLILRVSIVDVIGGHQSTLRLLCHPKQRLVHQFFVPGSRGPAIPGRNFLPRISPGILMLLPFPLHTSRGQYFCTSPARQALRGNDAFVELLQDLHIHTRLIIISSVNPRDTIFIRL